VRPAVATRELLAPREDVWAFVSTAERLPDWWPGVLGVQDNGDTWTIEGDERPGIGVFAGGTATGDESRHETVEVEKEPPRCLRLHFGNTGYHLELMLEATAPNRTTAELSIVNEAGHDSLLERVEEALLSGGGPTPVLAETLLEHLYELCQTGADT